MLSLIRVPTAEVNEDKGVLRSRNTPHQESRFGADSHLEEHSLVVWAFASSFGPCWLYSIDPADIIEQ